MNMDPIRAFRPSAVGDADAANRRNYSEGRPCTRSSERREALPGVQEAEDSQCEGRVLLLPGHGRVGKGKGGDPVTLSQPLIREISQAVHAGDTPARILASVTLRYALLGWRHERLDALASQVRDLLDALLLARPTLTFRAYDMRSGSPHLAFKSPVPIVLAPWLEWRHAEAFVGRWVERNAAEGFPVLATLELRAAEWLLGAAVWRC